MTLQDPRHAQHPATEPAVEPRSARTLLDLLAQAAVSERSGQTGLRLLDRRERARFFPWRRIHERATRTAARLTALGIEPGDRVALIHPTGEEFFDAFFGALLAGAVPVPLYPPVRLGRLEEYHRRTARMVEAAGARVLLADRRVRRLLGPVAERARPELGCPVPDELPEAFGTIGPDSRGPDDLALVQFSSGTTVDPKPVALSHRAVLAQTLALNRFWPDRPGEAGLTHSGVSWLPLYHDMGLIGCVFPALERVADLTLIGPEVFVARPAIWLRAISRYRATVSPAPNFAYGLCVDKVRDRDLEGVDLSSWRVALNGAEAVSAGTLRAFAERFAPYGFRPEALTPVYGLSEAALAVTFSDLERPFVSRRFVRESLEPGREARPGAGGDGGRVSETTRELVSVGTPLPGFEIQVRDAAAGGDGAGRPNRDRERPHPRLPESRVGRVWVRGPSLMTEYLGRPDATRRALVDGWLDTGDLGFLLDGALYLTGRAKDLVIVRGRNVAPEEIEAAAARAPGARTGCVVAASWMPDEREAEELTVFVEHARDASRQDRERLPRAVAEEVLAGVGLAPDRVEVLAPGTLPRTSSGKLRRGETVRRARAGTLEPPAPVSPLRLGAAMVRSGLAFARARRSRSAGSSEPEGSGE